MAAADGAAADGQVPRVDELGERIVPSGGNDQRGQPHPGARAAADGIEADDRPAEQTAGQEHVHMHRGVDQIVVFGGLVQAGQVESIESAQIEHHGGGRGDQDRDGETVQQPQQHPPRAARQRAQRQGDRRGQRQESRGRHAEQQMLADVHREQLVVAGDGGQHRGSGAECPGEHGCHPGDRPAEAASAQSVQAGAIPGECHQRQGQGDQLQHGSASWARVRAEK